MRDVSAFLPDLEQSLLSTKYNRRVMLVLSRMPSLVHHAKSLLRGSL